jgi:hypothetical protein
VAISEHREIRLFNSSSEVVKGFNLKTMEARHLKKILASLVNLKLEWLESGYFSASPVYLCAMVYNKAGLESDVPIHMINRVYAKAQGLVRYRPYEKVRIPGQDGRQFRTKMGDDSGAIWATFDRTQRISA